jgi:catechol 2,3-dioxygenase-like lactoylglutathione lyase family enzyme
VPQKPSRTVIAWMGPLLECSISSAGHAMHLRSVDLDLPDTELARTFLTTTWGLSAVSTDPGCAYFRGAAPLPYLMAVRKAATRALSAISFGVDAGELAALKARLQQRAQAFQDLPPQAGVPGAGPGISVEAEEGQVFRFISAAASGALPQDPDRPVRLSHIVLNALNPDKCAQFLIDVLGFKLSDRNKVMTFVRCDENHHAIAFVASDMSSLNHIAFEMPTLDAVMRGAGRMRDAGFNIAWGPGRHGAGNNVFAYFIAPFGPVIEYTAEVLQIDDSYRIRPPEEWRWPPGRIDQWGLGTKDNAGLRAAEEAFRFARHQPA